MARIPDDVVERIRDTADLLEIVQESVQLKRQGRDWRGPCPFHGGANRNFAVIPQKNLYYCFVCHAAGDVFTWYRERFGLDYPSAVREVARRYGIPIPEATERAGPDPREPLYQACDAAQTWFAARLRDDADAEPARRYLLARDFSLDAAAEIGLGWAPRGGTSSPPCVRSASRRQCSKRRDSPNDARMGPSIRVFEAGCSSRCMTSGGVPSASVGD